VRACVRDCVPVAALAFMGSIRQVSSMLPKPSPASPDPDESSDSTWSLTSSGYEPEDLEKAFPKSERWLQDVREPPEIYYRRKVRYWPDVKRHKRRQRLRAARAQAARLEAAAAGGS
jgi:hypothetical protein